MTLHCHIHDTFEEVKSNWATFLPSGHHLVSNDVLALENSRLSDLNMKYIDLYKNNTMIGVAYIQCLDFNTKQ